MRRTLLAGLLLTACGGRTGSTEQVNPCVSPNSSYVATYTNLEPEVAGACGPITPYVLNGNNGYGTAVPNDTTCASQTETGSPPAMCIVRLTDCTTTTKAVTVTLTDEYTWSSDGGGGTGVVTETIGTSTASCASTYSVTITRQ